jgi:hypothetical protein
MPLPGGAPRSPIELLERGVAELAEVLGPAGFEFIQTDEGADARGPFASGEFLRSDRRLEMIVRSSLGLVRYHFGEESLSHEDLVRGVRTLEGISAEGEYREGLPRLEEVGEQAPEEERLRRAGPVSDLAAPGFASEPTRQRGFKSPRDASV